MHPSHRSFLHTYIFNKKITRVNFLFLCFILKELQITKANHCSYFSWLVARFKQDNERFDQNSWLLSVFLWLSVFDRRVFYSDLLLNLLMNQKVSVGCTGVFTETGFFWQISYFRFMCQWNAQPINVSSYWLYAMYTTAVLCGLLLFWFLVPMFEYTDSPDDAKPLVAPALQQKVPARSNAPTKEHYMSTRQNAETILIQDLFKCSKGVLKRLLYKYNNSVLL